MKTKKTELLFVALILRMLKTGGRSATIVPDGVLFGSSGAHQALRKLLIDNNQLEAVISLPSGVLRGRATTYVELDLPHSQRAAHLEFGPGCQSADADALDNKFPPLCARH